MKKFLLTLLLLSSIFGFAQKMMTRNGVVKFEASVPTFEEIAATNATTSFVLDQSTGDIAALVLIKSFKFKSPLMEEHFNENYMESDKYPKASFKGKLIGFDAAKLSTSKTAYDAEGDLTIHNVTKKVKTKVFLQKKDNNIIFTGNFDVKPQDFNIDIPSLVKKKISENVSIDMNFNLEPKP